jgi:predicted permease
MPEVTGLLQDLRLGFRLLRRAPQLNTAVVLILALGIGLNAVVYSFFNGLLFRPNVAVDPSSFVRLYAQRSGTSFPEAHGVPTMMTLQEWEAISTQTTTLSALTASKWATFTLSGDTVASLRGLYVSCNFLTVHVRRTLIGRSLDESDCATPGAAPVVVLSERAWTAFFARDPAIVGRAFTVNGHTLTVVGVVPDRPVGDPDIRMLFVPYTMYAVLQGAEDPFRTSPDRHAWLNLSGRVAAGKSHDDVDVEVNALVDRLDLLHSDRATDVVVTDGALIREPGRARGIVGMVLAATTLMLLLVCANVATLLLSRAEARQREMAIRMALGATRGRLLTQLWIEGTVPALTAAALSVGVTFYVPDRLAGMLAGFPLGISLVPDMRVLAYTLAVALMAGTVASLSPALPALRGSADRGLLVPLQAEMAAAPRRTRRDHLITQQLAAALALLVAIGLVWHAQNRLIHATFPFEADRILVTNVDLGRLGYSPMRAAGLYSDLLAQMETLPGVLSVAVSTQPPFAGAVPARVAVAREDRTVALAALRPVSPNYFPLFGIRLVSGRLFSEAEAQSTAAPQPVVVSESLMRALWGSADASGQWVGLPDGTQAQVVGVVADASTVRVGESDGPVLYQPTSSAGRWSRAPAWPRLSVIAAVSTDSRPIADAVRRHVQGVDPQLLVVPETIADKISREADRYTTVVTLTALLAGTAFGLSLVGVYGVTAFVVAQRRKEIAIRTAVGARPQEIVRLFVWSQRRPLFMGAAAGTLLAASGAWWLRHAGLLPHTEAAETPWIYGAALTLLVLTAGAATALPAFRAARRDPSAFLRAE